MLAHLSDREQLQALDGELSAREMDRVKAHLEACWPCRTRRAELEKAIAGVVELHREMPLPPVDGPRALLKAQLAQAVREPAGRTPLWVNWKWAAGLAAAVCVAAGVLWWNSGSDPDVAVSIPDRNLTPGAAVLTSRGEVCREENTKNRAVPVALQRKIFEEYGIARARPHSYEVDYLITPALGGAEDIHNLWPQSYSATVWNARVKDALEDHLRELVCGGSLDLQTAQREIAMNWIEAYKKYFHTDRPLEQ